MKCIIVDDEPLARRAIELLMKEMPALELAGVFGDALPAGEFMAKEKVDLVFLDVRMPGMNGIDFARTIPQDTLVIFTTAFAEYALDSYEVEAIDYLVKPIEAERFRRAVEKAQSYKTVLDVESKKSTIERIENNYMFVKSERRFHKVLFDNILFIEGLKDYIIIQLHDQRMVTKMTLKAVYELLPKQVFMRVNRSYIVNTERIDSFDNNDIYIGKYEIAIGNSYRDYFFNEFVSRIL
ncbi:MAG: LytTR family DNA-binding domain-containing protein [Tannerellaceae bacterium]|nr:LytTR family DNA-binding domain-containing protein [Tannerellaceae bacterium]